MHCSGPGGQAAALYMQIGHKKEGWGLRDQLYLRVVLQSERQRGLDGITLVILQISLVILFPCFDSCGLALQCCLRSQFCFYSCGANHCGLVSQCCLLFQFCLISKTRWILRRTMRWNIFTKTLSVRALPFNGQ